MTVRVRDFAASDADAAVAVMREVVPYLVTTPSAFAWQIDHTVPEERYRVFVAELDGRVAGIVRANLIVRLPGRANVVAFVPPACRGQGIGAALASAGEAHVLAALGGSGTIGGWVSDDRQSVEFAERRGYRRHEAVEFRSVRLDGMAVPDSAVEPLPAGVTLRTGQYFDADPRPVYDLDVQAWRDVPSNAGAVPMPYDAWLAHSWRRPDVDRALTTVVLVVGVAAAYTIAQTDRTDRYWSSMTGTGSAFRGRGLATLAKRESLRRAREAGYRIAYTANDAANAPMIAVNEKLGYRYAATQWRYRREVATSAS
ncbi:MAG TPA: GNAT family N-acetyltransferase [Asanoa sp.]